MDQIEAVLEELYTDDQRKLKQICDREMSKFGGLSPKDYDDFYSRAGYEINLARNKYDASKGKTLMEYISGIVKHSVYKEMTDRNRLKRQAVIEKDEIDGSGNIVRKKEYISNLSLDALMDDEGDLTIGDTLLSDFDMNHILFESTGGFQDEKAEKFLNNLPVVQRKIVEMKMEGIPVSEIKEKLKLSDKQYNRHCREMKSFTNISILYESSNQIKYKEDDVEMSTTTQTMENCKTDKISIASIIKKIDKHTIRFDHPLQRESEQWSPAIKGNLVSDILQGNKLHPLIFAEQIINGVPIIWDLDGKQRCTNVYSFFKNGYKVSKNIRRWLIKYQTTKKDDHGRDVLDDNGFPIAINAEFDIRGKKFSDLPEELRDRFLDYSFNYDQYLNCSEDDIGYHIERYNDGKPMTSSQKGITKLGTEYAEMVKSISNMMFFKDMGGYKVSEFKNGTINRVVVESVMAANYLDKWNKLEDMCKYIKENASASVFDDFGELVERLEKVVTDEVSDLFDSKDSFLWFGLFARFVKSGLDDKRFIEFMIEFVQSLHGKALDGESFDDILSDNKSTKDKGIVIKKMNHLERLMNEYLGIDGFDTEDMGILEFVQKNICDSATQEDIELYKDCLEDLTVNVDNRTHLLERENRASLIAIIAYACNKDIYMDDWFVDYFKRTKTYQKNQEKNVLHMIRDLNAYTKKKKPKSA